MGRALRRAPAGRRRDWADPEGGFFFWLRLARPRQPKVFQRAVEEGVAFLPGTAFFPDPDETVGGRADGRPFARLCFTFAQRDEIAEGTRRLARALHAT